LPALGHAQFRGDFPVGESLQSADSSIARELKDQAAAQALSEHHWGWLCHDLGRYDEAQACYEGARQLRVEQFSEDSPEVAEVDFNLAWLLFDRHRTLESCDLLRKTLEVQRRFLPDDIPQVQTTAALLKAVLNRLKDGPNYDADEVNVVDILLKEGPGEVFELIDSYHKAQSLRQAKRYQEALPAYTRVHDRLASMVNPGHLLLVSLRVDLAGLHRDMGNLDSAEQIMRDAIESSGRLFDSNPKFVKPLMEFAKLRASKGGCGRSHRTVQAGARQYPRTRPSTRMRCPQRAVRLVAAESTIGKNGGNGECCAGVAPGHFSVPIWHGTFNRTSRVS
jgi:tetratricopeptide (TPR) repeat protein